jgi:hypothetical protein
VVCPFGFWATSKVIERRRHVRDRMSSLPAMERKVMPTRSAVVGVSLKADEVDTTSSARIIQALGQAVAAASVVKSWKELESAATARPGLLVLVTHTVEPDGGNVLGTSLELNGDLRPIHRISDAAINPGRQQPGPVVLALGCDTNTITAGYTDLVVNLHNAPCRGGVVGPVADSRQGRRRLPRAVHATAEGVAGHARAASLRCRDARCPPGHDCQG